MLKGLELDYEVADKITVLNLKDARKTLINENKMLEALERMEDYQSADFGYNHNMINAIGTVLHYYGED
jgi:hypothetical protein